MSNEEKKSNGRIRLSQLYSTPVGELIGIPLYIGIKKTLIYGIPSKMTEHCDLFPLEECTEYNTGLSLREMKTKTPHILSFDQVPNVGFNYLWALINDVICNISGMISFDDLIKTWRISAYLQIPNTSSVMVKLYADIRQARVRDTLSMDIPLSNDITECYRVILESDLISQQERKTSYLSDNARDAINSILATDGVRGLYYVCDLVKRIFSSKYSLLMTDTYDLLDPLKMHLSLITRPDGREYAFGSPTLGLYIKSGNGIPLTVLLPTSYPYKDIKTVKDKLFQSFSSRFTSTLKEMFEYHRTSIDCGLLDFYMDMKINPEHVEILSKYCHLPSAISEIYDEKAIPTPLKSLHGILARARAGSLKKRKIYVEVDPCNPDIITVTDATSVASYKVISHCESILVDVKEYKEPAITESKMVDLNCLYRNCLYSNSLLTIFRVILLSEFPYLTYLIKTCYPIGLSNLVSNESDIERYVTAARNENLRCLSSNDHPLQSLLTRLDKYSPFSVSHILDVSGIYRSGYGTVSVINPPHQVTAMYDYYIASVTPTCMLRAFYYSTDRKLISSSTFIEKFCTTWDINREGYLALLSTI